jgi:hypothetical protein
LLVALAAVCGRAGTNQWPNNLVSGTITFRGAPLAGVSITAFNTNTNTIIQVTTSDANGNYQLQLPAAVDNAGDGMDYHIWATKAGYGFYPSVGPGAEVIRADHTGDFQGNGVTDIAIYFEVVHYIAIPNMANRGIAGPPLSGGNFAAYDGSNPLVTLAAEGPLRRMANAAGARFMDNHDGTVTDSVTGLIWLKDAGCFDAASWFGALTQVNALANGSCGLSDGSAPGEWRMPNIGELESVVDISASNPAVAPGSPFTNVSTGIYWTSTSYFGGENGSPSAWAIRFADGRYINDWVANDKNTAYNQVWAVKGSGSGTYRLQSTGQYVRYAAGDDGHIESGVPLTFPRWVDKGDGTVVDTMTGLVWLKRADCVQGSWADAMAAAAGLASGQCGLTDGSEPGDWQIPTRSQMLSMADRMENNHADFFDHTYVYKNGALFQTAIFTNFMGYQFYWTSSTDVAEMNTAWTLYSCDFGVYDFDKDMPSYALAVRLPREADAVRGAANRGTPGRR